MDILTWAEQHLLSTTPHTLPVWHWTRAPGYTQEITSMLVPGGSFADWTEGALGRGLYVSLSAIDTIDKGPEVIYAEIPAGTRVLMVDADLFQTGVIEFMEMSLARMGWDWRPTPWRDVLRPNQALPARAVVPYLMDTLDLSAAVYIFGFQLAVMVRGAQALRYDPTVDPVETVAAYVRAHPQERPTLAPPDAARRWLAARGRG